MNGKKVLMTFPEARIGSRMFPPDRAKFLNDFYRQKGHAMINLARSITEGHFDLHEWRNCPMKRPSSASAACRAWAGGRQNMSCCAAWGAPTSFRVMM
jgi:hypothetical protein